MEQYDGPLFHCDNAPLDALAATGSGTEGLRAVSVAMIRLNEMSSFANDRGDKLAHATHWEAGRRFGSVAKHRKG